jgi:hypothetical protein
VTILSSFTRYHGSFELHLVAIGRIQQEIQRFEIFIIFDTKPCVRQYTFYAVFYAVSYERQFISTVAPVHFRRHLFLYQDQQIKQEIETDHLIYRRDRTIEY